MYCILRHALYMGNVCIGGAFEVQLGYKWCLEKLSIRLGMF